MWVIQCPLPLKLIFDTFSRIFFYLNNAFSPQKIDVIAWRSGTMAVGYMMYGIYNVRDI